jgi:excisionase family DNA binding protein
MNAAARIGTVPPCSVRGRDHADRGTFLSPFRGTSMPFTLSQAAKACGRGKTTVFRAIKSGRLSAVRDETGGTWLIEESELLRVFPPGTSDSVPWNNTEPARNAERKAWIAELEARVAELQGRITDSRETIADLRRRLDQEREERRAAQERIAALLTNQRAAPQRSWWPWGRHA